MMKRRVARKIGAGILFSIFGLLFFLLIVRFVTIQVTGEVEGRVLSAEAAEKYAKNRILESKRGTIYDQNGQVIAEESTSYKLIAVLDSSLTADIENPNHVTDPRKTAEILSQYIEMSETGIFARLTKKGAKQVEFGAAGRDIPSFIKNELAEKNLPGISFIEESKRFYPNGTFASHLIGFVMSEEVDGKMVTSGKMGIESSLNDMLSGVDGKIQYDSDKWGYLLPNGEELMTPPQDGFDVHLTLENKIQTFLEDALSRVEAEYKPEKMIAIVADPKTGEILGMGQRPTFHPDTRIGLDNWKNEVVEASIEPGSTMKSFSLAAAVDSGSFNPNATYQSGTYYVGDVPIRDHNYGNGWGVITFLEGVQHSSNVAFAYLLELMGEETYREYLDRFHFGVPTGIELPNEASGQILYHYPIEKVTTVFGQGTTLTPLQIIQAESAIANDGKMMKPYVIRKVVNPSSNEIVKENKPTVVGEPISPESAKLVREYLETTVTSPDGTGKYFDIEGYQVSGKSGTAQIADPNTGKYLDKSGSRTDYLFSFLGMAPSEDPQLIVYVAIQQPNFPGDEFGSIPVSKVFNPVMQNSLKYLNIEPDESVDTNEVTIPDIQRRSVKDISKKLTDLSLEPVIIGKGSTIKDVYPSSGEKVLSGEKVIIKTEGEAIIPDMTGWALRDVLKVVNATGLRFNMTGSGFVVKQNLASQSTIQKGDLLTVTLETPLQSMQNSSSEVDLESAPLN
ncbi:penicillin-binding protein [Bacillus sp. 2205SS5-2]|uniref:penicillin-binding protein n=1 Tax=Bacillus sp. 2205SS5-2 TaxID=3109031 RepID=UPI0030043B1E